MFLPSLTLCAISVMLTWTFVLVFSAAMLVQFLNVSSVCAHHAFTVCPQLVFQHVLSIDDNTIGHACLHLSLRLQLCVLCDFLWILEEFGLSRALKIMLRTDICIGRCDFS